MDEPAWEKCTGCGEWTPFLSALDDLRCPTCRTAAVDDRLAVALAGAARSASGPRAAGTVVVLPSEAYLG